MQATFMLLHGIRRVTASLRRCHRQRQHCLPYILFPLPPPWGLWPCLPSCASPPLLPIAVRPSTLCTLCTLCTMGPMVPPRGPRPNPPRFGGGSPSPHIPCPCPSSPPGPYGSFRPPQGSWSCPPQLWGGRLHLLPRPICPAPVSSPVGRRTFPSPPLTSRWSCHPTISPEIPHWSGE